MNLVQKSVQQGGKLTPLIIPAAITGGTGLMNPSIFIDDDGDIMCILRHINYTLYHSENDQRFPSIWGPLSYLHPEEDQHLRTTNYLCKLDEDFNIVNFCLIDTSKLDVTPIWEFVGLEDTRLVKWEGKYYGTGVRRDTTTNGQGRMELSELEIDKKAWTAKEVSRLRIPAPIDENSYCEKNWMPVLDKPFHYVKWSNPTELVRTYPNLPPRCEQVSLKEGTKTHSDQRGGSQLIRWGEYYIAITHEVVLSKNYIGQKDGVYRHRLCVWNTDFTLIGVSPEPWSFLDAKIEFVCGAANNGDLLLSWGFQDNAAFILSVPSQVVEEMIREAIYNGN
jgi:hypothetical protein